MMQSMGGNRRDSKCGLGLISSVALNLVLLGCLLVGSGYRGGRRLGWSSRAAEEAEAVASLNCSGHGRAYLDGLVLDGERPACECNSCFEGPACSQFVTGCVADANSGDPLFLEPFWMNHAASSAVLVAGWHRMSYSFSDHSYISKQLEKQIRKLHEIVGNAVVDEKFIVFGAGSTQLLNAAVHALSSHNSSSPSRVAVSIPFYPAYKEQTNFFESVGYKFYGATSLWNNTTDVSSDVIEFVTSPNNPDGQLKEAVLRGKNAKAIHDHAYYWPHFTAIPKPADEDLMIFTLSKLTGHAGARFGWALVKDEDVYEKMLTYTLENTFGVSHDTQLRALKLLTAVLEGGGTELFNFGHGTMRKRWLELKKTLSMSDRFSVQEIPPQYCSFFQKVRGPSPAYAWFKCEREEEQDCHGVLKDAGILGREGKRYGVDNRYVRLSLIKTQDDFDVLLRRLDALVSEDGVAVGSI